MTHSSLPPPTKPSARRWATHILDEGKFHSRQATEWERVETYWNVGNAIYVRILQGRERAEYGEQIIAKLAFDMNLGLALMHDIVLFRRALNILYTYRQLTWSHYRALIRLPTVDQRRFYERAANRGAWPVRRLQNEIQADLFQETAMASSPPPGRANTAATSPTCSTSRARRIPIR